VTIGDYLQVSMSDAPVGTPYAFMATAYVPGAALLPSDRVTFYLGTTAISSPTSVSGTVSGQAGKTISTFTFTTIRLASGN
jgi:hypothetical protein